MKLNAMTADTVTIEMTAQELREMIDAHNIAAEKLGSEPGTIMKKHAERHRWHSVFWLAIQVMSNNAPWGGED